MLDAESAPLGRAAVHGCLVGSGDARRSERARSPRQPERADARQGHVEPRAGARSRRPRSSSSSASTGRCPRCEAFIPPELIVAPARESRARLRQRRSHRRSPGRPHDGRRAAAPAAARRRPRGGARGAARTRWPGRRCATSCAAGARSRSASATARAPSRAQIVVPALLEELEGLVRLEDVVVLVATGTHRGNTERRAARDARRRGAGGGARRQPRRARRRLADLDGPLRRRRAGVAEQRVGATPTCASRRGSSSRTSSPASRAVRSSSRPGSPGLETTLTLHDAARIGHPEARWGVTRGQPRARRRARDRGGDGHALRARRRARRRAAHRAGLRRRAVRDARGRVRASSRQTAMRAVPAPVRRRR